MTEKVGSNLLSVLSEKDIAPNDWDGYFWTTEKYFWTTEKVRSNLLSIRSPESDCCVLFVGKC